MKYLLVLISMFLGSALAHDECITNGDCQALKGTVQTQSCIVANTGFDQYGGVACAKRCFKVEAGYLCKKGKGKIHGHCYQEKVPTTGYFDPSDPKRCENAREW